MRQRFTFSRGSQGRHRASTINSSGAISTPSSRPRSSTTPVSSNTTEIAWHNTDNSRYYHFTDEPGYFCPSSPIISRQDIAEDLEDEITHTCTMLVHDIDQGLPILPSLNTALRTSNGSDGMVRASYETHPEFQDQMTHVSPRMTTAKEFAACKPMHDSGVAFSAQSSRRGQHGRDSLSATRASAGAGRFYGRRSPPEEPCERGRQRGRSFATDATSLCSRSRSRTSSFDMFPYSPPQSTALWSHNIRKDIAPSANLFSEPESLLGAEGMAWLRANDDMHRLGDRNSPCQSDEHAGLTPFLLSGPGPRRFYSTRQLPSAKALGPRESSCELHSGLSVRSLPFDSDLHNPHSTQAYKAQTYSLVITPDANGPARHKRKKASQLFKKLAGIGMRRKEEPVEFRRPMVAAA
ncbi:Thioredoxin [Penicillium atrosanguineum]|uniref:Thioredoxin n=1 Tax=Penicillium atrosanguineum TaxID=1132637 RepID=UPI00239E33AA|nr:Thioredoxin [Penicillium atrosanguineum]KAJ5304049.1 Thioredoxin [Penicillium atrosanguineum]